MNYENNFPLIAPDVTETDKAASLSLLPDKSRRLYEKTYAEFMSWCEKENVSNYSEEVLMAYFTGIAEKGLRASLWPKYSMLKATLNVNDNIDISSYDTLLTFLKEQKVGYQPKKSKVLEKEHVKEFIEKAPDSLFLMSKVALIFGVAGAMRKDELYRLQRSDVEDMGSKFLVTVCSSRTQAKRIFTVVDNDEHTILELIKRYISLRPAHTPHERFFVFCRNNKCSVQPVGINTFYKLPSMIAKFLKLEQPNLYTGHCFRRSSASILADGGTDFSVVKGLGGWQPTSFSEEYNETVETAEKNVYNNNPSRVMDTSASTSSAHSFSDFVDPEYADEADYYYPMEQSTCDDLYQEDRKPFIGQGVFIDDTKNIMQFHEQAEPFVEEEKNDGRTEVVTWSNAETRTLLHLYEKYKPMVGTVNLRSLKQLWDMLAQEINKMLNTTFSPNHLENRMRVLDRSYKRYKEYQKKNRRGGRYFEFLEEMERIMEDQGNVNSSVSLDTETVEKTKEQEVQFDNQSPKAPRSIENIRGPVRTPVRRIPVRQSSFLKRTVILEKMRQDRKKFQDARLLQEERKLKLMEERNSLLRKQIELKEMKNCIR